MSQNPEAAHNILPYKMLDSVSSYLHKRLNFNPLSKVLNGDNEVLHLMYGQSEKAPKYIFPMYGKSRGCRSIAVPRLVHGASQRAFDIAHTVGRVSHNLPSSSANSTLLE